MDVEYDVAEGVLQLSRPDLLLLITIPPQEVSLLTGAREADWRTRQSITAGTMLGNACHWCQGEEPDTVQLLVGHDDETWELALTMSVSVVERIVASAKS